MPGLLKREAKHLEPVDLFSRLDRVFDQSVRAFPFPRPFSLAGVEWMPEDPIRIDEYQEDGVVVVKAELPGIEPDKDVELSVSDHVLHIAAEGILEIRVPAPEAAPTTKIPIEKP